MSPMLSLSKIQINDEDAFLNDTGSTFAGEQGRKPLEEIDAFFNGRFPLEATPKLDGSAIELQYIGDGKPGIKKLHKVVTRGEGGFGSDVTAKFGNKPGQIQVPIELNSTTMPGNIEVRGECVMSLEKFNAKWKDKGDGTGYKNPRNMVAGVISRDEITEQVGDIDFISYSLKIHENDQTFFPHNTMSVLKSFGFNTNILIRQVQSIQDLKSLYLDMKEYRRTTDYQLDGIVLKMPEALRTSIGETRHHPRWAVAVKFPSNEVTTIIKEIEWTVGYTGEIAPTAILEAVELDGSTVTRASLYNVNSIIEKGTMPGAEVSIRKAGEIIPQIVEVLHAMPKPSISDVAPACCPACNSVTKIDTDSKSGAIHVYCTNEKCIAKLTRKLHAGVSALKVMGIGEATCESLVKVGIENIADLFDADKVTLGTMVASGQFKQGRQLDLLMAAIKEPRQVELKQVIQALSYDGVGNTMSDQLARQMAGVDFSFDGLEKAKYEPWLVATSQQSYSLKHLTDVLKSRGWDIQMPKAKQAGGLLFEMTGDVCPPFKSKSDFAAAIAAKGYSHSSISKATVLVTDSLSSASGKMKTAAKKGMRIVTYLDLLEELGL
jgi:DNA ligase (NAD+)